MRIAVSLADGLPVELDTANLGSVLAAIAHASGKRVAWIAAAPADPA